jgi:surface polysaccharide O-acyltransferase-like enzyme
MRERNLSLDILKLIMAFMVIGIHTHFLSDVSTTLNYLFVNGVFRIAVPVFMIVSGFYFYPILQKHTLNIESYFKRIFILYIFWTAFYSYFWVKWLPASSHFLLIFWENFIIGYHHLWYLSGLLGATAVLYFFRQKSSLFIAASAITFFLIGVGIQYISYYHLISHKSLYCWMYRNFIFFSYPFLCIGYLISKHDYHNKVSLNLAKLLLIVGLLTLLLESFFNYTHRLQNSLDGFDILFSLILVCPAIFVFFIKQRMIGNSKEISLYATALYLIHPCVQNVLGFINRKYELNFIDGYYIFILVSVFAVLFAYFLIKINKRFSYIL